MHTQHDYPSHISDPFRRDIAVRYMRHELRKLFPNLRDEAAWTAIDADIAKWFKDDPLLMPVRDFWNGLHGISMGFRLKNIVSWLTSANIRWEERDVPVDDLWFGSTLRDMEPIGNAPSAREVRTWFYAPEHADALAKARADEETRGEQTMPRNNNPIFVVRKGDQLRVTDGNRRLLRAIYLDLPAINAVVGEPIANPPIFEAWVPTQTLIDLVSAHRYWTGIGRDLTDPVARVIAELIRDSSAGRTEFVHRSISRTNEADARLLEEVRGRLKENGTVLDLQ